jgi:hypothetical protein
MHGHVRVIKWGDCTEPPVVERIVRVCFGFREAVERLPDVLARQREPTGYRGGRTIPRPEDVARATAELAEVDRVRQIRRQVTGAKAGIVFIGLAVLAGALAWCSH